MAVQPESLSFSDADLRVVLQPAHGFTITELADVESEEPLLWRRTPSLSSPLPTRDLGPPGEASFEAFHRRFVGGWFAMFPAAGFSGELDGRATHFHGEIASLPWEVVDCGVRWVEARVETVHSSFVVVRRVSLESGVLRVITRVENVGSASASYMYGEHPCFSGATFAGGRLRLVAVSAAVPAPALDPARAMLTPGRSFVWPHAPSTTGAADLSRIPTTTDGRADHVCLELAERLVTLESPRLGRVAEFEVDLDTTPFALLAERFDETADMLAIEPSTAPGRGVRDAIVAGAVRTLGPGESFSSTATLRWRRL